MRTMNFGWLAIAGLLLAGPAQAHAVLVDSTPAIGASVPAGDTALRLRFNSRVDRTRSRLTLIRAGHDPQVIPIDPAGTEDLLLAHATLPAGPCVVRWQVLAVDGHITRGDVSLKVEPKK